MQKSLDNSRRERTYRWLTAAFCTTFVVIAFLQTAPAEDPGKRSGFEDFGAETVEAVKEKEEDELKPLPVELVEESLAETEAQAKAPETELSEKNAEVIKGDGKRHDLTQKLGSKTTVLNVTDGEISALIKTFSKLTGRNYIVDSAVRGKVTIHFPSEVTIEEALRIFDTVLLLKGFTSVPVQENVWKVIPAKDAKQTTIPFIKGTPEATSDAIVTEMLRLKYVSAEDMQQLLSQFISRDGLIKAVEGTNSLVIIDSASNIERLRGLSEQLDVPALDQEITIIAIYYADADDIAEKINDILGESDENKNKSSNIQTQFSQIQRRMPPPGGNQPPQSSGGSVTRRALPLKIIPDERTNSLIVVADPELTLKVRALAEQLDSKVDLSGGGFWVYRLKHADAEELAEIINNVISGAGETSSSTSSTKKTGSSISRSQSQSTRGTDAPNNQARLRQAIERSRALIRSQSTGGSQESGGRVSLEGEVSIAPDPSTNSLIINASRTDYQRLEEVIKALDIKRRQVLVEATLLEVSLNHEEGLGVELQGTAGFDNGALFGQTNFGGITNLLTNPAALSDLTLAAASTGTLTLPGGIVIPSQAVLISAVSRNQNVNVLSTPTILATDNEEAEIIVGENVPFVSSTSSDVSNLSNTFNQVDRQDVGITLRITPQISTGDFVTLKIFVEISNVVASTRNDPNGPTTTIRTSETKVEVKNGQMVITGGLIQDRVTDSSRGVPFLEDIPVLGQLFQRQDSTNSRTNLLIFITPRVISDQFEAREHTKEVSDSVQNDLDGRGVAPSREGVLRHDRINNVIEELPAENSALPTTITPPKVKNAPAKSEKDLEGSAEAISRTLSRLERLSATPDVETRNSEVLEISVAPRLPASTGRTAPGKTASLSKEQKPGSEPDGIKESAKTAGRTFVVLRDLAGAEPSSGFSYSDKEGTLGVILAGSIGSPMLSGLEVGRRLRLFASSGREREFVCLGVYASTAEAALVHPALSSLESWQVLPPSSTASLAVK
jgi:general secretion pathway protein D